MTTAVGIDIGGTGIKGALVDLDTGELVSERLKLATPEGGKPDDIINTVVELLEKIDPQATAPTIGICFPAVVRNGRTMSAANVSKKWIGLEAADMFSKAIGRKISFVNDADAAGYAEYHFGAAHGRSGLVIMTTLGTGIGSALIYNGVLIPNSELGHLEVDGHDAESRAAYSAKERDNLDWEAWAKRLQKYYSTVEKLFSPDLFIVGGGVSKSFKEFIPLLKLETPIIPAELRNNAGIIGAAKISAQ